jgi:hypothetical protein
MMSGKKYNPDNDVPSLEGKTIFITGGNEATIFSRVTKTTADRPQEPEA